MKKIIRGIIQSPRTAACGGGAGIIQIQQGLETRNYTLVITGVLTLLMGIFATDTK